MDSNRTSPEYLFAQAQLLAKAAGMTVIAPRNQAGKVIAYNLFRNTQPKLTFIGQRVNEKALIELIRRACPRPSVSPGLAAGPSKAAPL